MQPGLYDITIYQGATFTALFEWKDSSGGLVPLTGFTARMQARENHDSSTTILELTTANGGITLGGTAGTIALLMSATATAALTPIEGVYDLELVSAAGVVYRFLEGQLTVSPEVTR